jgi:hypothetical protein
VRHGTWPRADRVGTSALTGHAATKAQAARQQSGDLRHFGRILEDDLERLTLTIMDPHVEITAGTEVLARDYYGTWHRVLTLGGVETENHDLPVVWIAVLAEINAAIGKSRWLA